MNKSSSKNSISAIKVAEEPLLTILVEEVQTVVVAVFVVALVVTLVARSRRKLVANLGKFPNRLRKIGQNLATIYLI
jgi:hypothetical protein